MDTGTIDLVAFDESHLDGAVSLSREAGWLHRREDWAMSLPLSRGFAAMQDGRVVGTAMLTPFGDDCATINMVIVAAALRGRGLGRRLMNAVIAAAGARECRLVATPEGMPLYETLGFRASHEINQHQADLGAPPDAPPQNGVVWASEADEPAIAALDRAAHGIDRTALTHRLAEVGRLAVLREGGRLAGYGALRSFGRGELVGPVIAQTQDQARALIDFLAAARSGTVLRIDTLATSGLSPWLAGRGLPQVGGGVAMRRGSTSAPPAGPARPFALASQALG
jgi:predicted N-acetyltransferase YhbS